MFADDFTSIDNFEKHLGLGKDKYKQIYDLDFTFLLPDMRKIITIDESIIVYHGRECSLKYISIYEYKQYYLLFYVTNSGDELDVANIFDIFGDGDGSLDLNYLLDQVVVYRKDSFDITFIAKKMKHIDSVLKLFVTFENYDMFNKYMKTEFNKINKSLYKT